MVCLFAFTHHSVFSLPSHSSTQHSFLSIIETKVRHNTYCNVMIPFCLPAFTHPSVPPLPSYSASHHSLLYKWHKKLHKIITLMAQLLLLSLFVHPLFLLYFQLILVNSVPLLSLSIPPSLPFHLIHSHYSSTVSPSLPSSLPFPPVSFYPSVLSRRCSLPPFRLPFLHEHKTEKQEGNVEENESSYGRLNNEKSVKQQKYI